MYNKKFFICIIIVVLLTILYFFVPINTLKFYSNNIDDIEKIIIGDGSNGKIEELTYQEELITVMEYLSSLRVRNSIRLPGMGGWSYRIEVYLKNGNLYKYTFLGDGLILNKKPYRFTTKMTLTINGKTYK